MRTQKVQMKLAAFAAICLLPLCAGAASSEVPRTGQTACYDADGASVDCAGTGQDGDWLAGIAWPDPRFADNGDGTVTDGLTGLVWAKDADVMAGRDPGFDTDGTPADGRVTWQHALDYVAKLNSEAYLGQTDWRLPNSNELDSLVHAGLYDPAISQGSPFTNVQTTIYWSATSRQSSPVYAWGVNMLGGTVNGNAPKSGSYAVWPVRTGSCGASGGATLCLPRTGQTSCFDQGGSPVTCLGTGQDGDDQAGAQWPDPRFTDNGDGTATDGLTGLIWVKDFNLMVTRDPGFDADGDAGDGMVSWQHALDYAAKLNSEAYLGHTDWRLPNRQELRSLIDFGQTKPALPQDCPFTFLSEQSGYYYWSSTTYAAADYKNSAWYPDLEGGIASEAYKGETQRVCLVRGGRTATADTTTTTTATTGTTTTTTAAAASTTTTACPAAQVLGPDDPGLETLRAFRDSRLARSAVGRAVIRIYYANADGLSAALEKSPALRTFARRMLTLMTAGADGAR